MASTSYYMETPEGRIGYGLPQPYDAATAYTLRDCVTWQGSAYIVLKDVQGVTPSDDRVNYAMLAQRGADGAGNARIFVGTAVTGKGSAISAVVAGSAAGDVYINSETGDLYQASAADVWAWQMNLLASSAKVNNIQAVDGNITLTGQNVPMSATDERTVQQTVAENTQAIKDALGGLTFAVNADDGGLDVTYTYTD